MVKSYGSSGITKSNLRNVHGSGINKRNQEIGARQCLHFLPNGTRCNGNVMTPFCTKRRGCRVAWDGIHPELAAAIIESSEDPDCSPEEWDDLAVSVRSARGVQRKIVKKQSVNKIKLYTDKLAKIAAEAVEAAEVPEVPGVPEAPEEEDLEDLDDLDDPVDHDAIVPMDVEDVE